MDAKSQEVWQNSAEGIVVLLKTDRRGEVTHEVVNGGSKFTISTQDRLLNQDRAANDQLDVFKNGMLTPVRLLDGTEDAAEIASNPNLMTESDMQELFKGHWRHFETKVNEISNPTTLHRLQQIARDQNATIRQMEVITARLNVVQPAPYEEVSQVGMTDERETSRISGTTPK